MKDVSKYLWTGNDEAFIPLEKDEDSSTASKRIKSYCFRLRAVAKTETIYGCNAKGEGFRFIHVKLDKPMERKHEWNRQY